MMPDFHKIHAEARISILGYGTDIASFAMAAAWKKDSAEFLSEQIREAIQRARKSLDEIEGLLNREDARCRSTLS